MTALVEAERSETSSVNVAPRRVAWLLAIAVLVIVGPIVARPSAQPASRYALTAALVERQSVDVHGFHLGVDHAIYDGRWRSDKAPGQPLLAVPFYAAGRVLGLRPATYLRKTGDLGLWWEVLWSSVVPLAAIAAMCFHAARRFAPRSALTVTIVSLASTLLLPYGAVLYGHEMAAAFAFGAWLVADSARRGDRGRLAIAGVLAGCAFAVEYHVVIVAVVIAAVVAYRYRRDAWAFAAGAVPPLAITAVYQWAAFGKPWRLPYAYYAGVINGTSEGGYKLPSASQLLSVFTGNNGLLLLTPLTVLAMAAALYVARRPGPARAHAAVALAASVAYVTLIAGWSGTPIAEDPGPRYLVPALPFLVVPLAIVWDRIRRLGIATAIFGGVMMALATFTDMLVGIGEPRFRGYMRHVRAHAFSGTLWSTAFGRAGAVLYVMSVAAVVLVVFRTWRRYTNECSPDLLGAGILAGSHERRDHHPGRP